MICFCLAVPVTLSFLSFRPPPPPPHVYVLRSLLLYVHGEHYVFLFLITWWQAVTHKYYLLRISPVCSQTWKVMTGKSWWLEWKIVMITQLLLSWYWFNIIIINQKVSPWYCVNQIALSIALFFSIYTLFTSSILLQCELFSLKICALQLSCSTDVMTSLRNVLHCWIKKLKPHVNNKQQQAWNGQVATYLLKYYDTFILLVMH